MNSRSVQIYGIANCDTMKKARAWLTDNAIDYDFHDYKKAGIDEDTLRHWISYTGWEVLLNRRGTTWRKVAQEIRDSIDETTAINLMLESPSMIKRPVLEVDNQLEVGFNSERYAQLFGGG